MKAESRMRRQKPCLTLQICQFGIQGTCGHQCNAKCQILMVRSQLVPNRHQRRWPFIMHLPNVDMPIGHQHIHLPLRQIDSVGHRKQGQWIDACVRPAFQLLVAEDMSARRSMSMTHWWLNDVIMTFGHVPVASLYKETGPTAFLLSPCSCEACKPCKGYVGPNAGILQASCMSTLRRQPASDNKAIIRSPGCRHMTALQLAATHLTYLGDLIDSCGSVTAVSFAVTGSQMRTQPSSKLISSELSCSRSSCRG